MCDEGKNCCGCYGPQGPQGIQGLQGPQGVQGPSGMDGQQGLIGPQGLQGVSGINGQPGSIGPQGLQGIPGPQGLQGLQGIAGQSCDNTCCDRAYLSIYSLINQTIGSGQAASFEVIYLNSGDFDLTNSATSGKVKFLKHGIYELNWGFDGLLQPPYPFPVPAWGLSIYLNGVPQPVSSSGSCSISPDDICTHDSATYISEFKANDVITLVNISNMPLAAISNPFGLISPVAAVRLNLNLIKSLP